ncbi:MAG: hypothetical protein AAGA48_15005 [Myxococcota bacterium]
MARLAVTLVAIGIWLAMGQIPLPFLHAEVNWALGQVQPWASLTMLGSSSFFYGFLFVEVVAMLTPRGQSFVRGGAYGRAVLWRWSVRVGLALAALDAWGLSSQLALHSGYPPLVVKWVDPWVFQVVATATLVAATGVLIGLVRWVGQAGLGHGFVVFLLFEEMRELVSYATHLQGEALFSLVVIVAFTLVARRFAVPHLLLWGVLYPLSFAFTLVATPNLAGVSSTPLMVRNVVIVVALVAVTAFLSRRPSVVALMGSPSDDVRATRAANAGRIGFMAAIAMAAVYAVLIMVGRPFLEMGGETMMIYALVATMLWFDLGEELYYRVSAREPWVAAWPIHQPYRVAVAQRAMKRSDIPYFLRGLGYRMLLGPFDPRVPIEVMVPKNRLEEAQTQLEAAIAPA